MKRNNYKMVFKSVVPYKNFITPHVEGYSGNEKYAIELSSGLWLDGKIVYGVTVVDIEKMEQSHDLSKCFFDKDCANSYIDELLNS